ncbi:hypothetical protein MA9V1_239 [Chryseobacterium phage MA9V-1]|nr:hypothetical protein MA9V1_239 [Chryseobacterium phage MA9V-1]
MIDKTKRPNDKVNFAIFYIALICLAMGAMWYGLSKMKNKFAERNERSNAKTLERIYVVTYNNGDVDTLKVTSYDVILDQGDFIGRTITTNTTYASNVRTYKQLTANNK